MKQFFTRQILQWAAGIDRRMPWKETKDPYLIWLSEIILQQTRVEQGLPYFLKFREKYPNVNRLAKASQDEVLKLWQGLGYYSRARNLHSAAQYISNELNGVFPQNFVELKKLKGIGDYTAAAIASFAYNQPHAVLDGNVYRLLSRFFGIHTSIDGTEGKKEFSKLANELIDRKMPGVYNQAVMDFGSLQCKPANPDCSNCPLNTHCYAFKKDLTAELPVKTKKISRKERFFHYLVLRNEDNYYLSKRVEKDIWQNLYEFPMVENDSLLEDKEVESKIHGLKSLLKGNLEYSASYRQLLTHQQINAVFYVGELKSSASRGNWLKVKKEKLGNFAFPKVIDCYLKDNSLYFNHS